MTVDHHSGIEEAVFHAVNASAGSLVDAAAVVLSERTFGILAGLALAVAIALDRRRERRERLALVLALGAAVAASDFIGAQVLRPLFGRMRPCFALPPGTFRWLVASSDVGSLPSLHASNFFAVALVARAARRALGAAALALAVAVSWSRVYVGVHWPTDVVAGAAWGALCAALALAIVRVSSAREAGGPPFGPGPPPEPPG
ncbi:MAG TPA: phosphatase PAP2 family protein [Anaeromyxobacter sp.]